MEKNILFFIVYVIEALILLQYSDSTFVVKRRKCSKYILLFSSYSVLSLIFSLNIFSLNGLLFFLVNSFFIYYIYDTTFFSSLFHGLLTTIMMSLSELLILSAFPELAINFYEETHFFENLTFLTVGSKIIYFLLLFILSSIFSTKRISASLSRKESFILLIIPTFSFIIFYTLLTVCMNYEVSPKLNRLIFFSTFLLLIINILIWGIYRYILRKSQESLEMQLQLQKEMYSAEHYSALLKQDESQKIMVHDIKNHLNSIALLNQQRESQKISDYISNLLDSYELTKPTFFCDHALLNAIISHYNNHCSAQNITFHVDIRSNVVSFLTPEHITALFCNLLDNAIEAIQPQQDSFIELLVTIPENRNYTLITLKNSCPQAPRYNHFEIITSKSDSSLHGYGLKSIRQIAEQYNGEYYFCYDEKEHIFSSSVLLRNSSFEE